MADAKITALTEATSLVDADVFPVVTDIATVPVTKKITLSNLGIIRKLATVDSINAKTVTTTTLYTVPAGKSLIVDNIIVRVTSFTSGGKTVQARATTGANSPNYNDCSDNTFTVSAVNQFLSVSTAIGLSADPAPLLIYAAGSDFRILFLTASNATTEIWSVDLFGYLV